MKTINLLALCLSFVLFMPDLVAQVPQGIPYQAVARDNQTLLTNELIDVRFSILEGGTLVYQEIQGVQTNEFGLFSLVIGKGQQIGMNSFSDINWGNQAHYLKVELKRDSAFVNMGTTALESVPYSLYSEQAKSLDGGLDNISDVVAPAPAAGDVLRWDGNMWVASPGGGNSYAGTGIRISNDTIYNTGDDNPVDDIIIGTGARGDLDGAYPDPMVIKLRGRDISSTPPLTGQVLKWNGNTNLWTPAPDDGGNGGGVNVGATIDGDGSLTNPIELAQQGAGFGQALKWNGSSWAPANDSVNTQELRLSGTLLTLTNGGGSVNLPFINYLPGTGIQILGSVISNTGDTDATDDITDQTDAAGDLSGKFPNVKVVKLNGDPISTNRPSDQDILRFYAGRWEPDIDRINDSDADPFNEIQTIQRNGNDLELSTGGGRITMQSYIAGPGMTLTATSDPNVTRIDNTGDPNALDDVTTSTIAQGDIGGSFFNLRINALQDNPVSADNPSPGDVLTYTSGGQWIPATNDDADPSPTNELQTLSIVGNRIFLSNGGDITLPDPPTYTGGPGITINGTIISNTGDLIEGDDIKNTTPAGGDLSGFYPDPVVEQIQGYKVSDSPPSNGDILIWNGNWTPSSSYDDDPNNEFQTLNLTGNTLSISPNGNNVDLPIYTAGAGIDILNNVVINTGDLIEGDDLKISSSAQGDISGTFSNLKVTAIQNSPVTSTTPSQDGQILKWDQVQGQWGLGSDEGAVYTAGAGIDILTGNVIENTGDLNPNDDVLKTDQAVGDVIGQFDNLSVIKLRGSAISTTTPTTPGQVLKWSGTEWEPDTDQGTIYTAGVGINITGANELVNTGDTDGSDDVLKTDVAGGDLRGNFDSLIVTHLGGRELANTPPLLGEVLKWNGSQWEASPDSSLDGDSNPTNELQTLGISGTKITLTNGGEVDLPYTAGTGIQLSGTQIINTGDPNEADDVKDTDNAGGDVSGIFSNLAVTHIRGFEVSPATPGTDGLVLKWNGNTNMWTPAPDDTLTLTAGTGINLSNNNISLDNTSVSSGTYGSATTVPSFTVDAQGRITGVSEIPITDENTTYASGAGLDLTGTTFALKNTSVTAGTYGTTSLVPSFTVDAQGRITNVNEILITDQNTQYTAGSGLSLSSNAFSLSPTGVTSGIYGSATEIPIISVDAQGRISNVSTTTFTDNNTTYSAGTGLSLAGTTFNLDNTGVTAGTYGSATIVPVLNIDAQGRITGVTNTTITDNNTTYTAGTGLSLSSNEFSLNNTGVTAGTYGNATTVPVLDIDAQGRITGVSNTTITDNNTTYTGGAGINITGGNVIQNTGILGSTNAGGDLSGTFSTLQLDKIQGITLSASAPDTGEILFYDGTNWLADTLSSAHLNIESSLLPQTDDVYNLGSASNRFNTVYATVGTINTSDIREKKDINNLEYGLEEIMKLRPVSFTWKNRYTGSRKLGLIAQQVLPIMEEVVKTHEYKRNPRTQKNEKVELNRYGIYYSDLIPVLIKGTQEQQRLIEDQEFLIQQHEDKIDRQEKMLQEQQRMIEELARRLEKLEEEK